MQNVAGNCACRGAVERVYREFTGRGADDSRAFETAVRVYRFHHPDADFRQACYAVAEWVAAPDD